MCLCVRVSVRACCESVCWQAHEILVRSLRYILMGVEFANSTLETKIEAKRGKKIRRKDKIAGEKVFI